MLDIRINHKIILALLLLLSLALSTTVTIISQDELSDGISITFSVIAVIGIIAVLATIFLELIESICNP